MNISNNKILVTGGGSGIGLGLTKRFVAEGNTVIICGRRADVLAETAAQNAGVITKECDLSDESEREALFNWVQAEHPDLNVLVNNAGIQHWMNISDENFYQKAKQEIRVNVEAPLHLMSLFLHLPSLTTFMNVTSGLAFVPLSRVPVYCATKAFFHSFSLSARQLLREQHIELIEIIPPALNTDLGGKGLHDAYPPVSDFIDAIFQQLREGKTELTFGTSEAMTKTGAADLKAVFERLNPAR